MTKSLDVKIDHRHHLLDDILAKKDGALSADRSEPLERDVAPVRAMLTRLHDSGTRVANDPHLSPTGRRDRLSTLRAEIVDPVVATFTAKMSAIMKTKEEWETRASRWGHAPTGSGYIEMPKPAQTVEHILRRQEIRDEFRKLDDRARHEMVLRAAQAGPEGQELIDALDDAPSFFPLVTPEVRAEIRRHRIAGSPWASLIAELHADLEIRSMYRVRVERTVDEIIAAALRA
jgi:hypothetical protein